MKTRFVEARRRNGVLPIIVSCHIPVDEKTWKAICNFFDFTYISQIENCWAPPAVAITRNNRDIFAYFLTLSSASFTKEFRP